MVEQVGARHAQKCISMRMSMPVCMRLVLSLSLRAAFADYAFSGCPGAIVMSLIFTTNSPRMFQRGCSEKVVSSFKVSGLNLVRLCGSDLQVFSSRTLSLLQ